MRTSRFSRLSRLNQFHGIAVFALAGLLGVLPSAASAGDGAADVRREARDSRPSKAGDTPSSVGSREVAPAPAPAPAPSSTPASSTASQPDDRRGDARHRPGAHPGGSGHGRPWRGGGHWGGYYGPYGYGYHPYGYWAWSTWWPGYGYYDGPYVGRRRAEAGAIDTDVSPGRAEVWVDGDYVGTADDFDGFPTFLWLPKGTYDVVFYREGFQTLARQYTIYPGLIIDVEDDLVPGESTRPEDLVSRSTVRRDARLRQDREQAEEVESRERAGDSWRERRGSSGAPESAGDGIVVLRLEPGDASVYLDGRFIGTGDELARLPRGVVVAAGEHEVEVVRPGYVPTRRRLSLEAGESVELAIDLERAAD
jgi:hypothetical protein